MGKERISRKKKNNDNNKSSGNSDKSGSKRSGRRGRHVQKAKKRSVPSESSIYVYIIIDGGRNGEEKKNPNPKTLEMVVKDTNGMWKLQTVFGCWNWNDSYLIYDENYGKVCMFIYGKEEE